MLVCTLGDLMLDVVVRSGSELVPGGDVPGETQVLPGGQAANVAAWVAHLGEASRFIGKRGDDLAGRLAAEELTRRGVEVVGPVVTGRSGVVVSLVGPDGERTMASDRGVSAELRPEEVARGWLACDHLHISGYALGSEPQRSAAELAARHARSHGAGLSVDLGAATVVRTAGRRGFRETLHRLAPDIVFCTEDEERAIGGRLGRTTTWIVKLGARGVRVGAEHHPAATVDSVLDATGAGDAFAAGWIVGGTALALDAGARCVQQVGAMPSAPPLSPGNGCG